MKISVVACELPHPQGTAAGRDLWAWCEGARALGHELDAWVWFRSTSSPEGPIPEWCRYEPFDFGPMWRSHMRSILRPRSDIARAGWEPAEGAIAVADHYWSFAAVAPFPRSVATFHFHGRTDVHAVGRRLAPADIQTARAERHIARRARLVLAYSDELRRRLKPTAWVVPIAYPVPEEPVRPVEEPIAGLLADWSWPPNRRALEFLLAIWPSVAEAVPGARLVLGGRNLDLMSIGRIPGVDLVGSVAASEEFLSQVAVVAFPCPPSSGPKVKVIEALAHGLPVVTTWAGTEGIIHRDASGVQVADGPDFARTLGELLRSPERRASLGRIGRHTIESNHSAQASARARLEAFASVFGT